METLRKSKEKLEFAKENNRSERWCLSLWAKFIKMRDGYCCKVCLSHVDLQAHHIFRKTTFQLGMLEMGNGITLCKICHSKVHAEFNGKPDLSKPLGFGGGDDQDEAAFLYGLLAEDARLRGIEGDEYYFISDEMLLLFVKFQGYRHLYNSVKSGNISRIRCAHEIWRGMPEEFYKRLAFDLFSE